MNGDLALRLQARAIRATWDQPRRLGSLPAVVMGVLGMTLAVACISLAGGHLGELGDVTARLLRAVARIAEGG